jgi:pantothenate kinase-related protein Tda10
LHSQGGWKNFDSLPSKISNYSQLFIEAISATIDKAYPDKVSAKVDKIPLHMPLKIGLYGPKLSGKSTYAAKLS